MDYDRWDAVLHYLFRQTQGDAWFRPDEQNISSGVAVRISPGAPDVNNPANSVPPEFRIFPYERKELEPFEQAVVGLNPEVAVKVRSAAVHAALAETPAEDYSIYVDSNTRIQILDTMLHLPSADKEQCAAFIRDERVLVVWSHSLDAIIPTVHDFEERLIKLLWRSRPPMPPSASASIAGSVSGHSLSHINSRNSASRSGLRNATPGLRASSSAHGHDEKDIVGLGISDTATRRRVDDALDSSVDKRWRKKVEKRTWFGRKVEVDIVEEEDEDDLEGGESRTRPTLLYAPFYNGIAAAMAFLFIGNGLKIVIQEWFLDGSFIRFAFVIALPLLYCVSLFFCLQLVQNLSMALGPVAHFHENSKYYSAIKPKPNKAVDNSLPHITIQMPVYKESLEAVLQPSIHSLKKAMQTYARQGGTSTIFINDDGLRVISEAERDERIAFYANHGIGWVARPKHDDAPEGFKRAGRFKKASNMNYGLKLSLRAEKNLESLIVAQKANPEKSKRSSTLGNSSTGTHSVSNNTPLTSSLGAEVEAGEVSGPQYGMQYQHRQGDDDMQGMTVIAADEDLEEKALGMAIEEVFEESGKRFRPWAANGKACRLGEIVLLVDSDTVVPEDCLRDAAREMRECPTVAIIQHESDVLQVAHHYFENGIAYFTRRVNRCISMACANGEVAPFMGHNAFLRWKAIQDAAFVDPADGEVKIWSESNVSEDFDMALRLLQKGYLIRWATYSKGGFKEGVSLTIDDEMNRWQKYAYGCNELLFNPLVQWLRKGPIAKQIHRFVWSAAPLHYKISTLSYMFSYYGIGATVLLGIINYIMLGFQFPVDGFYMRSFEIFLATTVVFYGTGNFGYTMLEYRLGHKPLFKGFLENIMWVPYFFFFFGGMAIPVGQALLAHLFSYNITWSATIKEVERSNFFKEVPKIAKRFWFPMIVSLIIIIGIIICSTTLVPYQWRVDGNGWAVIFPLATTTGCHILLPIVLNPWLMIFSY